MEKTHSSLKVKPLIALSGVSLRRDSKIWMTDLSTVCPQNDILRFRSFNQFYQNWFVSLQDNYYQYSDGLCHGLYLLDTEAMCEAPNGSSRISFEDTEQSKLHGDQIDYGNSVEAWWLSRPQLMEIGNYLQDWKTRRLISHCYTRHILALVNIFRNQINKELL